MAEDEAMSLLYDTATERGAWFRRACQQPLCGTDFCDQCGDCLDCQWGECYRNDVGTHMWCVEYEPTAADLALLATYQDEEE